MSKSSLIICLTFLSITVITLIGIVVVFLSQKMEIKDINNSINYIDSQINDVNDSDFEELDYNDLGYSEESNNDSLSQPESDVNSSLEVMDENTLDLNPINDFDDIDDINY